ncbi:MAG: aminotransferase class I/II-fold pyridoxal phosphate-dependent enzyme, partial [Fervidobacterium sp.]
MHGGVKDENTIDFSISVNTFVPDFIKAGFGNVLKYETRYTYVEWIEKDFKNLFGEDCTIVAGATEALQIIGWTIMKDACVLIPLPNYTEYEKIAKFSSSYVKTVRILEDGRLNMDCLLQSVEKELKKPEKIVIVLGNPNNPTGIYQDLNGFLKDLQYYSEKITVIVDEAFVDFVPNEFLRHIDLDIFENVIILRTFTKILGIPGVRIGYVKTRKYKNL